MFFVPLFTEEYIGYDWEELTTIYLDPVVIIFVIAALIGYTMPITILTLLFIYLDHLLGLSKRLPSL